MLNIAYTHTRVVLVIFYYMVQNKQPNNRYSCIIRYMHDVGGCVICIYPIKLNIATRKDVK